MRMFKTTLLTILLTGSLALFLGCGTATNNDQGAAFTFLGWFTGAASGSEQLPPQELGKTVPLSFSAPEQQADQFEQDNPVNIGGAVFSFAGVQNNMTDQFVRVERIHHEYFIPGADIQPPDTVVLFSAIVGPAVGEGGINSSLPDSFADSGNRLVGGAMVVPPSIMEWLNFNRASLPELPFLMNVSSYVEGVTSAGDTISTNRISYTVEFVPDNVIPPTPAGASTSADTSDTTASASSEGSEVAGSGGVAESVDPVSVDGSDAESGVGAADDGIA